MQYVNKTRKCCITFRGERERVWVAGDTRWAQVFWSFLRWRHGMGTGIVDLLEMETGGILEILEMESRGILEFLEMETPDGHRYFGVF
jgi:hypothetical protein